MSKNEPHEVDLRFRVDEKLWRRIEAGDVDKANTNKIRANKLRLQVSVVREEYATIDRATEGKWNGVAEARAGEVAVLVAGDISAVCVDEPTKDRPGHALIAMTLPPGATLVEGQQEFLREKLVDKFEIVVQPTKVKKPNT